MDLNHHLALSYYKTIATINESHHVFLVQHQSSKRIFIKKILDVYNIDVYNDLYAHPIPGTPEIIEYFEEDDKLYLIEEYISGTPLSDKLVSHDLNEAGILRYMSDLCDIIEKLHALEPPVIHRDIKPSNIIITNYDHAILLDFNAAKQYASQEREDTVFLGTQGYAAPEQYGFGASSPQTDIYSLGIVLKEMLTACNSTSLQLKQIAEKCTQLEPKERYHSISELKKALKPVERKASDHHFSCNLESYLLPGFRSHTPWKMFIASIGYILIFWLSLSSEIKTSSIAILWTDRIMTLAMLLSIVLGCFNYRNIQQFMPLCQSRNRITRYLGIALLDFLLIFILFVILTIIQPLFL